MTATGGEMPVEVADTLADDDYDEFGFLHQNAEEWGLPQAAAPVVRRSVEIGPGRSMSYLAWGQDPPEVVFLHGGAQNAHTWDTVALALGRPAIAFDLPGHGRSYWRADRNYGPWANAKAVAAAMAEVAPHVRALVGMSLGGATAMRLAAVYPNLAERTVLVDVTPQINDPSRSLTTVQRGTVSLIGAAPSYPTFDAMADAAVKLSPYRDAAGVRRGVRHNARRTDDGRWVWRYDLFADPPPSTGAWRDFTPLWYDVERIEMPVLFIRGALSPFVLDEDVERMQRRVPDLTVEIVAGAGHAVQSDQPLVLVERLETFMLGGAPAAADGTRA